MASYPETLQRIYHLRGGMIDLRLDRMQRALAIFDEPQDACPAIHIAGTNGKGSTAAMLGATLSAAGYRTALYTSPHLVSFTERIRIDDAEIRPDEVVGIAEEIRQKTAAVGVPLTFFEFVTVMAFVYFARRGAEVAVIEVGLGGRLDATNVITPLVSAITTISQDHEAYLGPDEISIGREKGGIIIAGVPVAIGKVSGAVGELLRGMADEKGAPAFSLGRHFGFFLKPDGRFDYTGIKQHYRDLELGLRGRHQRSNAAVALAALELISARFPCAESALRAGLKQVRWPGRLEVMLERPTVILDGAHNPEGVRALVDELVALRSGRKIRLLFATMADKQWRPMLAGLAAVVDEVTLTKVDMERSADPARLAQELGPVRLPHRVVPDARAAARALIDEAEPNDIVLIAGSLYLLGEVRPLVEEIAAARRARPPSPAHS
jgi:dihydrofolate synthase/folylpolyglutamate synthase